MITDFMKMKQRGEKISMVTAYDYYMGKLAEKAGIDMVLVGDSLGMVVQGRENTLAVTLKDIIYHTRLVKRGINTTFLVADLPFMSYQIGVEEALKSAGRIIKESGAEAVKLEGGTRVVPQIKALVEAGIPVMGHLGLTPQSVNQIGGFRVQGKSRDQARELINDALSLQEAGVFSIVLETIPRQLATMITEELEIPTIGIGAGPDCDGQVLVIHDLLGVEPDFKPAFVRRYADLNNIIQKALKEYDTDVKNGNFPDDAESFTMDEEIAARLKEELE